VADWLDGRRDELPGFGLAGRAAVPVSESA